MLCCSTFLAASGVAATEDAQREDCWIEGRSNNDWGVKGGMTDRDGSWGMFFERFDDGGETGREIGWNGV